MKNFSLKPFLILITLGGVAKITPSFATTTNLTSGTLSQNITLGSGDIVNFNGGTLSGSISASPNNSGTVNFNNSTTLGGSVGTSSDWDGPNRIGSINIADSVTVSTGISNDIGAQEMILGNGSILEYQFRYSSSPYSYISGTIRGSSDGYGDVEFSAGRGIFVTGSLGTSTHKLNKISLLSGTISTTGISSPKIYANSIVIANNTAISIPSQGTDFEFTTLNPLSTNGGTVYLDGTRTFSSSQFLGNERPFQLISARAGTITSNTDISTQTLAIGRDTTFNQNSGDLTATNIILSGENSKLVYSGGTISGQVYGSDGYFEIAADFTSSSDLGPYVPLRIDVLANKTLTTGGTINASNINLASGAKLKYSSGTLSGTVRGTSNGVGIFEVDNNYSGSLAIGTSSASLASVLVNSGKTLTLNGNVYATNTDVSGTLNFGSNARQIHGNLTTNSSATMTLGRYTNSVSGNLTIGGSNIINSEIRDTNDMGGVVAAGVATLGASPTLNLTIDTNAHIANGSTYTLFSGGSGSSLSAIPDAAINVNGTGTNQADRFTFTTSQSGNNIILRISSIVTPIVVPHPTSSQSYSILSTVDGSNINGSLRVLKGYIENNSVSTEQKQIALKTAAPQSDNSINNNAINLAKISILTAEERLGFASGVSSGETMQGYGMWIKTFGSTINQRNIGDDEGYHSIATGFALGVDKEISDEGKLGVFLSNTSSDNKSNLGTKSLRVRSYRGNIYGGYNFEKFFIDGLVGFSWNQYNSLRSVPSAAVTAKADFDGQTYSAKIRGGKRISLQKNLTLTPTLALTFLNNRIAQYEEHDANSLNLRVKNNAFNFFEGRAGLRLQYDERVNSDTIISPSIRVSYGHDFIGDRQSSVNNFTGYNQSFTDRSAKPYTNSLVVGSGLNIYNSNSISAEINYNHEHRKKYSAHSGDLRIRYDF